jgi:hypothetical protein
MPDYSKGKVYKITSGDKTYIGSTCEPTLARRLANHISECKRWKEGKRRLTTSYPLIESGDYQITLIELCPCGSKDELTARERYWIENTDCVNKFIPGRTPDEYREATKEQTAERMKTYYVDNKEKIDEKNKLYRKSNPEVMKKAMTKYREANRDKINEDQRKYREANRDKVNEYKRLWRADRRSKSLPTI